MYRLKDYAILNKHVLNEPLFKMKVFPSIYY